MQQHKSARVCGVSSGGLSATRMAKNSAGYKPLWRPTQFEKPAPMRHRFMLIVPMMSRKDGLWIAMLACPQIWIDVLSAELSFRINLQILQQWTRVYFLLADFLLNAQVFAQCSIRLLIKQVTDLRMVRTENSVLSTDQGCLKHLLGHRHDGVDEWL